jgi:hypothetical protein
MIDDQLTASVEEIGQRLLAVLAVEDILLVDLDPRQLATLGAQCVSLMREFLFLFLAAPCEQQPTQLPRQLWDGSFVSLVFVVGFRKTFPGQV